MNYLQLPYTRADVCIRSYRIEPQLLKQTLSLVLFMPRYPLDLPPCNSFTTTSRSLADKTTFSYPMALVTIPISCRERLASFPVGLTSSKGFSTLDFEAIADQSGRSPDRCFASRIHVVLKDLAPSLGSSAHS